MAVLASCAPGGAPGSAHAGECQEQAFALARAVYASTLRPRGLDEVRARVLAGAPPPPSATKELRELADVRAAVTGDDAPSRRLLAGIAEQLGVEGVLVVSDRPSLAPAPAPSSPPAPTAEAETAPSSEAPAGTEAPAETEAPASTDASVEKEEASPTEAPAGAEAAPGEADPVAAAQEAGAPHPVSARLFLAATGSFDAARYEPEIGASGPTAWRGTVASVRGRFPAPAARSPVPLEAPPPRLPSDGKEGRPLYASPWLWGAIGAAALLGGFFWFASQDTASEPIHLRMRVPR